jgi:hypothetical protein
MTRKRDRFYQALPPYFGGKRRLNPWIFGHLNTILPKSEWKNRVFLDAFTGGGAVSLFAKRHGFGQIYANDWSARSQLVMDGLLRNQQTILSREDLLLVTQHLSDASGIIETELAGSVFSHRHAQALDQLMSWANGFKSPTKRSLAKLVIWHMISQYVCMPTSVGTSNRPYADVLDGRRNWQTLNPKRFIDGSFPRLLQPSFQGLETKRQAINAGVFCGTPVMGSQLDAVEFITHIRAIFSISIPHMPKRSNMKRLTGSLIAFSVLINLSCPPLLSAPACKRCRPCLNPPSISLSGSSRMATKWCVWTS